MKNHRLCFAALFLSISLGSAVAGNLTEFTNILSFDGTNGSEPSGALIQGKDGLLYGTTYSGGASNGGTVFSFDPLDGFLYTLHDFSLPAGGFAPFAGLVRASDGNLYGTTTEGGTDELTDFGVIFRFKPFDLVAGPFESVITPIEPRPDFTNLYAFSVTDGAHPWAGPLVQGRDGFLYGTTEAGGADDIGSIFQISTNGFFNSLCSLNGSGGHTPYGGMIEGLDGSFYGTTSVGGPGIWGTIFKITPDGAYSDLYSFPFNGLSGAIPFGGLVQGADGNLYGTTTQGGPSYRDTNSVNGQGFGTIFKITTNGVLTTLFSFSGTNGSYPYGPLMLATDGRLYGTTISGGAYTNQLFGDVGYAGYGTLFRITTNGEFTSLYSFDRTNGAQPLGTPLQLADGSFYGTTQRGGAYELGTIYRFRVSLPPSLGAPTVITNECGIPESLFVDKITNYNNGALTLVWSVNNQPMSTNTSDALGVSFAFFPSLVSLPLGTNVITLTASDADGDSASCSTVVKIIDTKPPVITSATALPSVLWPPRNKMVTVKVLALLQEFCAGATYKIIGVDSSGIPPSAQNQRFPYWQIIDNETVALRAELGPGGRDRVYHITLQATDLAGNVSAPRVVVVTVSKNQPSNAKNKAVP